MTRVVRHHHSQPSPGSLAAASVGVLADPGTGTSAPGLVDAQTDSTASYAAEEVVPAHLLDGGEVVILAIKPSPWFVLFRSFRWLAGLTLVALLAPALGGGVGWSRLLTQAVFVAAVFVVGVALLHWVSRLYVLTNRRIMRFRGILNIEIFETPLIHIEECTLSVAPHERLLRLGTIGFDTPDEPTGQLRWSHIARPQEVHRQVHDALRRASFNGSVGARRSIAWSSLPLAPLKEIKGELDVTVNDVILGLTGGAVRRYLELQGELPDEPLYAMMPVSTRKKGDKTVNNQVRDVAVDWGTDVADPVERIQRISAGTRKAKRDAAKDEGPISFIKTMAESLMPGTTKMVVRGSAAFADRLPLPGNCVVSNVRLTDFPMYIAGAKIVGMVPMSVLAPTQGINITVVTYDGDLHFGVIADPRRCAEPWVIAEGIAKSLSELQASMEEWNEAAA